ncbi:MAG: hypothetical protein JWL77_4438 [Chthonomonadaceae bacterium]|nr:hypothetical protein [Chthonomonadaceae bacterium]
MHTQNIHARRVEAPAVRTRSGARRLSIRRRTSLTDGTDAGPVAAPTMLFQAQTQDADQIQAENPISPAAVGYWNPHTETVQSAVRLLWGARDRIDNGVRVTVHGLGSGYSDRHMAAVSLFVHFPTRQPGVCVPFNVWNFHNDGLNDDDRPVSFCIPVRRSEGMTLSVVYPEQTDSTNASTLVSTEHVCRFSIAPWNKQPKLRQGVYFIALPDDRSNVVPEWDECRFVPIYEGGELAGGTLWSGPRPVPFHYLILSVDPVEAVANRAA